MAGRSKACRVRRTRQQWAGLVAEQLDSGLSERAYCEGRGISASSFANARRRLGATQRNASAHQAVSAFVPVNLDSNTTPSPASGTWDIELALAAGVVLRIRST